MGNELAVARPNVFRRVLLALRSETPVVGLDRPDERRIISPVVSAYSGGQKTRDEAIDAKVSDVNRILGETEQGRTARFIDLCGSTRTRDSRLDAVCRTRVLAIQGRPYILRPPVGYETDPEAKKIAAWVSTKFDQTRDLETLFGHLAHAALYGHACLEHQWFRADGEWRTQPRWVHPNRFAWDTASERVGFTKPGWFGSSTIPEDQYLDGFIDKFVFHNPVAGLSAYPWQRGALRSRVLASIIKRLGIAFWVKMLERWGQPQVYVIKPPPGGAGTGEAAAGDEDDRIKEMLRSLSSTWHGLVPHGASIETIAANVHPELHEKWVNYQNIEDAIAILGQNLSTEISMGGSYAAAKAHALVRLDYLAADLSELTSTLTDQWIRQLVWYNFGGSAPVPYIDWFMQPKGAWTVGDFNAGLCTADELRNSNGWDAEADGAGNRYSPTAIAEVLKAVQVAKDSGLRPTRKSLERLFAGAGLEFEPEAPALPAPALPTP